MQLYLQSVWGLGQLIIPTQKDSGRLLIKFLIKNNGGLAQLARALAWHARGRRFDPDTLHKLNPAPAGFFVYAFWDYNNCHKP